MGDRQAFRRRVGALVVAGATVAGTVWGIGASAEAQQATGSLGNRVFIDLDADGLMGTNDRGLAGVPVRLSTLEGVPVVVGETAPGGWWGVDDLPMGSCYRLSFDLPDGYDVTKRGGPYHYRSAIDETGSVPDPVCVSYGSEDRFLAGFVPTDAAVPAVGNIGNRAFIDQNANGRFDPPEAGLWSLKVTVSRLDGTPVVVGWTTEGGWWGVNVLDVGECYRVAYDIPTGFAVGPKDPLGSENGSVIESDGSIAEPVCITETTNHSLDAGFVPIGENPTSGVGNRAFIDENRNGTMEAHEPGLEGVQVRLSDPDGGARIVGVTGPGGWWGIDDLPNACYHLTYVVPPGYEVAPWGSGPLGSKLADSGDIGRTCLRGGRDNAHLGGFVPLEDPAPAQPTGTDTFVIATTVGASTGMGDAIGGVITVTNQTSADLAAGAITISGRSYGTFTVGNLPSGLCYDVTLSEWNGTHERTFCPDEPHDWMAFDVPYQI